MLRFYNRFLFTASAILLSHSLASSVFADSETMSGTSMPPSQDNTVTKTTIQPSANGTTVTKTVETNRTVVTTIPVPNSNIPAPEGYVSCTTVDAGWRDSAWVPSHKICTYSNSTSGVAWVEGYWQCNKVTTNGACTNWEWHDEYWSKTVPAY